MSGKILTLYLVIFGLRSVIGEACLSWELFDRNDMEIVFVLGDYRVGHGHRGIAGAWETYNFEVAKDWVINSQ